MGFFARKVTKKMEQKAKEQARITNLSSDEKDAFKTLWRTGVITKEQLAEHFQLKGQRLSDFQQHGYFRFYNDLVTLSDKGVRYCSENLAMKHRYYASSSRFAHDLKQTHAYLQLPPDIRETWKTEAELREMAERSNGYMFYRDEMTEKYGSRYYATVDAAIYSKEHGGYIGFECVTSNYTKRDIQMKQDFANQFLKGIYTY